MDEYTKQLEEENDALKKRLEEAELKAECYDFIMFNAIYNPKYGNATKSEVSDKNIVLFMKSEIKRDSIPSLKVANDMIEDIKMGQGMWRGAK